MTAQTQSLSIADLIQEPVYAHYSFDLWMTLIRSHPRFKEERALYFHQSYNPLNQPLDRVRAAFRKVDLMCNAINERTGLNIEAEEMYLMVLYELAPEYSWEDLDLAGLYHTVEELVLHYPPRIYTADIPEHLYQLKARGATMNILSNTAFIKGSTLRKILPYAGLDGLFDFTLFSDETGYSKPNPKMFACMHETSRALHPHLEPVQIIHVGDNPNADIKGAQHYGLSTFLVHQ